MYLKPVCDKESIEPNYGDEDIIEPEMSENSYKMIEECKMPENCE